MVVTALPVLSNLSTDARRRSSSVNQHFPLICSFPCISPVALHQLVKSSYAVALEACQQWPSASLGLISIFQQMLSFWQGPHAEAAQLRGTCGTHRHVDKQHLGTAAISSSQSGIISCSCQHLQVGFCQTSCILEARVDLVHQSASIK